MAEATSIAVYPYRVLVLACSLLEPSLQLADSKSDILVDLTGIEPVTSSMP
jgi:hypothetical protein